MPKERFAVSVFCLATRIRPEFLIQAGHHSVRILHPLDQSLRFRGKEQKWTGSRRILSSGAGGARSNTRGSGPSTRRRPGRLAAR